MTDPLRPPRARRRHTLALAALVTTVAALGATAAPAHAQPTAEAKQQAKAAFGRAEAAEKRKDWQTAITEYQAAYDALPHPDVLYNIAVDFERLEEYRDAATYYRRYLDEKDDAADRAKVEALIEKLRARPGVVSVITDDAGQAVQIDGEVRGRTPLEVKLAGKHEVAVKGTDGTWTRREIDVEYGEAKEVRVSLIAHDGTLIVGSNVAGAQVMVDDQVVGVTPFRGAVPAGAHTVEVSAPGWSTASRPVDVPAEGSTQATMNLVRPVGWTPPVQPVPETRFYIAVGGGGAITGDTGYLYEVLFGGRRGRVDFALGYGIGSASAAFVLETRVALATGNVRPYIGASALLGGTSMVLGNVGALVNLPRKDGARYQTGLYAQLGVGVARTSSSSGSTSDAASALVVPLIAGLQFSY
ncbi:MAG: PEGA domain-containing protein [Kofleriaceae bacterium]|nr:PEGA domain-containing protein [Myxococcales bacterium]MCB9561366.1 PEGA domain-containing protein [Kofleriaceae bacterium]MCB9574208.1 PEGA domain-containing protein [Kofleriaceae bacterium]